MKKILILFLILFSFLSFIACSKDSPTSTSNQVTIVYDYSDFLSLHINEVASQLSQEESVYYLYYYQLTCSACNVIKQELLVKVDSLRTDKVYFVNVLSSSSIPQGVMVTGTPSLVKVAGGVAIEVISGASSVLEEISTLE